MLSQDGSKAGLLKADITLCTPCKSSSIHQDNNEKVIRGACLPDRCAGGRFSDPRQPLTSMWEQGNTAVKFLMYKLRLQVRGRCRKSLEWLQNSMKASCNGSNFKSFKQIPTNILYIVIKQECQVPKHENPDFMQEGLMPAYNLLTRHQWLFHDRPGKPASG